MSEVNVWEKDPVQCRVSLTGYPARPHKEWMETQAALNRLPGMMKKLRG